MSSREQLRQDAGEQLKLTSISPDSIVNRISGENPILDALNKENGCWQLHELIAQTLDTPV